MNNYIEHAKREFLLLGYKPIEEEDNPNKWIQENVIALLKVLGGQGHSRSSVAFCVGYFEKLAMFEPLSPLKGTEDEWTKIGDNCWQNKRAPTVFKDEENKAWDIEGKTFRDPDGSCYTNYESKIEINFPYTPKKEYVNVNSKNKE